MQITYDNFPSITSENEKTYFRHLEGVISSIDPCAVIGATKKPEGIQVRISPSDYKSLLNLLIEVKKLNSGFGLYVEFSKSMKTSSNICYNINF